MSRKKQLPLQWMLVTVIILTAVVYGTHETVKNIAASPASKMYSQNGFFQFLKNILGIQSSYSDGTSSKNGGSNYNNPNYRQTESVNPGGQPDQNPSSLKYGSALQGSMGAQKGNNAESAPGLNAELNLKNDSEINTKGSSDNYSELNAQNNAELNAEFNAELNAENGPEGNADNNIAGNSEVNADNSSGNAATNAQTNAENNPDNNSGTGSGGTSENNPGNNSPDNSDNNQPNVPDYSNQSNLPTINPIPSDDQVSQSITKQNQQSDTLAALLAARQALVVPVQQEAQASKYQTVKSQSIPAPNTDPAPADVIAKVKSNQAVVSH